MKNITIFLVVCLFKLISCDVPTNCTYAETVGKWTLYIEKSNSSNKLECNRVIKPYQKITVQLLFPDTVVDEAGNTGKWTMVYNQGFEIRLNGRTYFAFQFSRESSPKAWTSYCDRTFNGFVHDVVKDNEYPPKNWACYYARKVHPHSYHKTDVVDNGLSDINEKTLYGLKYELVEEINKHQSSWKAAIYEEYAQFTVADLVQRSGGVRTMKRPSKRDVTEPMLMQNQQLPDAFDWRNKSGQIFVTPVRNQGKCGSCYAFASMGQLESGVLIQTNGRISIVLSPQDVVSCSKYSQGCDGGFPYLIAGRYSQDFGAVPEESYPYLGNTTKCEEKTGCMRIYVSEYGYVGGFYGGCNEELMKAALLKYGPLSVGIEVGEDFMHYKGGIYHKTGLKSLDVKFNPFEQTNHAVLLVGYGIDHDSGEKYWIVKNSWGREWGEDGFFRIRRGTDEIGIESIAVYAVPYLGH